MEERDFRSLSLAQGYRDEVVALPTRSSAGSSQIDKPILPKSTKIKRERGAGVFSDEDDYADDYPPTDFGGDKNEVALMDSKIWRQMEDRGLLVGGHAESNSFAKYFLAFGAVIAIFGLVSKTRKS
eukprot:TRINITY_DN1444_c0_g1_i2.p1 TRINITY_DN1444_c0_g1~~TRINITY_DN1444_c0_g1_i2.p1  ORF type:complete len:126 (+),score=19.76 TRINITY_DN1444_c0_g1_i2:89-466(+)